MKRCDEMKYRLEKSYEKEAIFWVLYWIIHPPSPFCLFMKKLGLLLMMSTFTGV